MEIKIEKVKTPAPLVPEDKLGFGHVFTDHMLMMDWDSKDGWQNARILPLTNRFACSILTLAIF